MGFLGTYSPRLDEKGRMALPARFRTDFVAGVVITKGADKCLYVFPAEAWERVTEAVTTAASAAPGDTALPRGAARVLFSSASEEVPDKQGRVVIPKDLRDYAGLDRDCVVIGANTRLEIWDRARWDAYLEEQEPQYSARTGEVVPGLL